MLVALLIFFSKNISIYAIFNDRSFNDMSTNEIVSFEQLSPCLKENFVFLFCFFFHNIGRTWIHIM